jgi:hypothetical protein
MVAEEHVLVGGHIVQPVVVPVRGRHALAVEFEHAVGDEEAVVAVGDQVAADGCDHDPQGTDGLASGQGHGPQRKGAGHGHDKPHQVAADAVHADVSRG